MMFVKLFVLSCLLAISNAAALTVTPQFPEGTTAPDCGSGDCTGLQIMEGPWGDKQIQNVQLSCQVTVTEDKKPGEFTLLLNLDRDVYSITPYNLELIDINKEEIQFTFTNAESTVPISTFVFGFEVSYFIDRGDTAIPDGYCSTDGVAVVTTNDTTQLSTDRATTVRDTTRFSTDRATTTRDTTRFSTDRATTTRETTRSPTDRATTIRDTTLFAIDKATTTRDATQFSTDRATTSSVKETTTTVRITPSTTGRTTFSQLPSSTLPPKIPDTTISDCTSSDCSGLLIIEGPWGDNQIQNVQLSCQVTVTEDKKPGEFTLLLNLDRDVYAITPHNLQLIDINKEELQFTFTNAESTVPISTFLFSFEVSYFVDRGDKAVPDGYCSNGEVVLTTRETTQFSTDRPITSSTKETTTVRITPSTTGRTTFSQLPSNGTTLSLKIPETTISDCSSGNCSGLQIMDGPWGDKQIQNVQLSCQVMVTDDKKPGEFTLLLNLDRDVYSITPHNLNLIDINKEEIQFTFTNTESTVPVSMFVFDFELSYFIDQGDTTIPDGYCSNGEVTTRATTPFSTERAITSTAKETTTTVRITPSTIGRKTFSQLPSDGTTVVPKIPETTISDCGSGNCSGLQIMDGPWGDKQIQNVQLSCQVIVTEDKKPGEFTLLLNLDRDVYSITPHNLELIDINKELIQFTFTNAESTVPISTFVFDFEVSYFIDQEDTAIPDGYCSTDEVVVVTTRETTPFSTDRPITSSNKDSTTSVRFTPSTTGRTTFSQLPTNEATVTPKIPETTVSVSGCGSGDCSGLQIVNGPWGDKQIQNVQLSCQVTVTEYKKPGQFTLLLDLDRDVYTITPHNLDLIGINKEEIQFTFTNADSTVPISTFVFDFEVSYFIDQGDTAIPDGNCSIVGVVEVTTSPTTRFSTDGTVTTRETTHYSTEKAITSSARETTTPIRITPSTPGLTTFSHSPSNEATTAPKIPETTVSDCVSEACSEVQILKGPWGDDQVQNVQLHCQVVVTELKNPGEFTLLLNLDRDIYSITPHNLDLVDINKEELQFTFTNTESTVPISTFVFDFEVSYFVDQGDIAIPDGYCSTDGGNNYASAVAVTPRDTTQTSTKRALTSSTTETISVRITPFTTAKTSVRQLSSSGATITSTILATTAYDCGSDECSELQVITGPWGDSKEVQNVQMNCQVTVSESKNLGELTVVLSLDRDTESVTPHNMKLVDIGPNRLQFTFTNSYYVNVGTLVFDFELSYRVDQGNTDIPDGTCSGIEQTSQTQTVAALTSSYTETTSVINRKTTPYSTPTTGISTGVTVIFTTVPLKTTPRTSDQPISSSTESSSTRSKTVMTSGVPPKTSSSGSSTIPISQTTSTPSSTGVTEMTTGSTLVTERYSSLSASPKISPSPRPSSSIGKTEMTTSVISQTGTKPTSMSTQYSTGSSSITSKTTLSTGSTTLKSPKTFTSSLTSSSTEPSISTAKKIMTTSDPFVPSDTTSARPLTSITTESVSSTSVKETTSVGNPFLTSSWLISSTRNTPTESSSGAMVSEETSVVTPVQASTSLISSTIQSSTDPSTAGDVSEKTSDVTPVKTSTLLTPSTTQSPTVLSTLSPSSLTHISTETSTTAPVTEDSSIVTTLSTLTMLNSSSTQSPPGVTEQISIVTPVSTLTTLTPSTTQSPTQSSSTDDVTAIKTGKTSVTTLTASTYSTYGVSSGSHPMASVSYAASSSFKPSSSADVTVMTKGITYASPSKTGISSVSSSTDASTGSTSETTRIATSPTPSSIVSSTSGRESTATASSTKMNFETTGTTSDSKSSSASILSTLVVSQISTEATVMTSGVNPFTNPSTSVSSASSLASSSTKLLSSTGISVKTTGVEASTTQTASATPSSTGSLTSGSQSTLHFDTTGSTLESETSPVASALPQTSLPVASSSSTAPTQTNTNATLPTNPTTTASSIASSSTESPSSNGIAVIATSVTPAEDSTSVSSSTKLSIDSSSPIVVSVTTTSATASSTTISKTGSSNSNGFTTMTSDNNVITTSMATATSTISPSTKSSTSKGVTVITPVSDTTLSTTSSPSKVPTTVIKSAVTVSSSGVTVMTAETSTVEPASSTITASKQSSTYGGQSTTNITLTTNLTSAMSPITTSTTAYNITTTAFQSSVTVRSSDDEANIFSKIGDGDLYSIAIVAGVALAFLILLALLIWCIYYYACRRRPTRRVDDKKHNKMKRQDNFTVRSVSPQNSSTNLLPSKGQGSRTTITPIGQSPTFGWV